MKNYLVEVRLPQTEGEEERVQVLQLFDMKENASEEEIVDAIKEAYELDMDAWKIHAYKEK